MNFIIIVLSVFSMLFNSSNTFDVSAFRLQLFRWASDLTDPACKSHEFFRRLNVETQLHPDSTWWDKTVLTVQWMKHATYALVTTLPGVALRAVANSIEEKPFLAIEEPGIVKKVLPNDRVFTLFSWNICCVGAGYPISDGGVLPWDERIDRIIKKIEEVDADVNCLYETFDTSSAFQLHARLKEKGYKYFYFNIGSKAIGVSSGIFIASKYQVSNPEFIPFSADTLVGRTKHAGKGVFSFDLESDGHCFARLFTTHLQHSEEPEFPTEEERAGRSQQMALIVEKMQKEVGKTLILTGDLNLDDAEYQEAPWHALFQQDTAVNGKTWGGDAFCATLGGKRISSPLNLDHTLLLKYGEHSIKTELIDVGFEGTVFKDEALSDHRGLFSKIFVS